MRDAHARRHVAAFAGLAILWLVPLAAGQDPRASGRTRTGFLPSQDMLPVANTKGRGSALDGSCSGIVELAISFKKNRDTFAPGLGDALPPLRRLGDAIETTQGGAFLERMTQAAHHHSRSRGSVRATMGERDPATGKQTPEGAHRVADRMKSLLDAPDAEPQRLVLKGPDGAHAVAVYDYEEHPDRIVFRVADPNYPPGDSQADGIADSRTIVYVKPSGRKPGGFEPYDGKTDVGVTTSPIPDSLKYLDILTKGLEGKIPDVPIVPPPGEHHLSPGAAVSNDPEVGGVLVRFDPELFEGAATEEEIESIAWQVESFLASGGKGAAVFRLAGVVEELHLVSLSRLLETGSSTLGWLTRVRGYVRTSDGEIFIAGRVEPDGEPIDLDLFTVALAAIWKGNLTPFVSLDPDPANFSGPQKVRVGGVPRGMADSRFVEILLEADYLMKKISLGTVRPEVDGLRTWTDILLESGQPGELATRMWLAPLALPVADQYETVDLGDEAVLFESRVQILSEAMKLLGDFAGTGETDPASAEAAASLTRHYGALARRHVEFRRLETAFEVAKLAAVLRARGVASGVLERLAAREVRSVSIPATYDGIGPLEVAGTSLSVSGGVKARPRAARGARVATDRLLPLIDSARASSGEQEWSVGTIELPASFEIDPANLAAANGELSLSSGIQAFAELEYESARRDLDLAIAADPELAEAYVYRALTLYSLGEIGPALADGDRAVEFDDSLRGFRAVLRVHAGDPAGALADAAAAESAHSDSEAVLAWCGEARILAADLAGARTVVERLLSISPIDPGGYNLRSMIELLEKMGPELAAERIAMLVAVPVPISEAYMIGIVALQTLQFEVAVVSLERARKLVQRRGSDRATYDSFHLEERVLFSLAAAQNANAAMQGAMAQAMQQMGVAGPGLGEGLEGAALRTAQALREKQPLWPSALVLVAQIGLKRGLSWQEALDLYGRAVRADPAGDPLLADFEVSLGTDRALAYLGLALWYGLPSEAQGSEAGSRHLDHVIDGLGDTLEAELLATIQSAQELTPALALEKMREAHGRIPESLAPDPLALWVVGFFYSALLATEDEYGEPERLFEEANRFLKVTSVEGLSYEAMTQIAVFRFAAMSAIGQRLAKEFERDPRIEDLRSGLASGTIDPSNVKRVLGEILEGKLERVRPSGSEFAAAMVRSLVLPASTGLEHDLKGIAEGFYQDLPEGEAARRLRATLDDWTTTRPGPSAEDPGEIMSRYFGDLVEAAHTEVDLRTLSFLAQIFERTAAAAAATQPEVAQSMNRMLATLKSKLEKHAKLRKRESTKRIESPDPVRDRPARGQETTPEGPRKAGKEGEEGAGEEGQGQGEGLPAWVVPFAAGVGCTLVLVIVVLVALRRRRSSP